MMSKHLCAVPACDTTTQSNRLMCFNHWKLVPLPMQRTITKLYNNDRPLNGYQDACLNAVQQVQDKLAAK